jgi:hypothetical protein
MAGSQSRSHPSTRGRRDAKPARDTRPNFTRFIIDYGRLCQKPARDSGPCPPRFRRIPSGFRALRGRTRRVTGARPRPQSGVLCPVTPMGSAPTPARDIRTRPAASAVLHGAPPASRAPQPGSPPDHDAFAPEPASDVSRADTPARNSSAACPSLLRVCTTSGTPYIATASPSRAGSPTDGAWRPARRVTRGRGGSRKRRSDRHRSGALDHETAARWISPKAPLKRTGVSTRRSARSLADRPHAHYPREQPARRHDRSRRGGRDGRVLPVPRGRAPAQL